jgi:single-strand DNA-binding protein
MFSSVDFNFNFNQEKTMCLNQVTLIGYAGNAPEVLKETQNGKFVRFSLATTKKYMDEQGHPQQTTQWHTVYASNGRGTALAAHLQKGALIAVTGELRYSEWKDKKTGESRFSAGVYADDVKFLGSKSVSKNEAPESIMQPAAEKSQDIPL